MDNIITSKSLTVEQVFKSIGSTNGFLNLLERNYKEYFHQIFLDCPENIQWELTYGVLNDSSGKTSYCIERVLQNRFSRGEDISQLYSLEACTSCGGYRVGDEAQSMKINNKHIGEIATMSLIEVKHFIDNLVTEKILSSFGIELSSSIRH